MFDILEGRDPLRSEAEGQKSLFPVSEESVNSTLAIIAANPTAIVIEAGAHLIRSNPELNSV